MMRLLSALFVFTACAQAQSFEVASIRLHKPPARRVGTSLSGPRFTADAMSLENLITYAYGLRDYQVSGVPPWGRSTVDADRYNIAAKAEGDGVLSPDQSKVMLQSLLADRFRVAFHRETRQLPVYELVVAKNGPKLKESAPDAQTMLMMGGSRGIEITATRVGIAMLVNQISNHNGVDRPVLDKTQLTGSYDFKLTWTLESGALGTDPEAVSIALQEQLGLKLESAKAPLEILVIDHAEKPSEN
jgi:uncharacterized protein (TIGR03435 family)